jgi:hypothetical protein
MRVLKSAASFIVSSRSHPDDASHCSFLAAIHPFSTIYISFNYMNKNLMVSSIADLLETTNSQQRFNNNKVEDKAGKQTVRHVVKISNSKNSA